MVIEDEKEIVVDAQDFVQLQRTQHAHDMRNHFDIISLHKTERMKHYGLHYAKYIGRLARGASEAKSVERTVIDTLLINLSAANTLQQDLSKENFPAVFSTAESFNNFADAAGRFADACEKIDHMEEFVSMARLANRDITSWVIFMVSSRRIDVWDAVQRRRQELSDRHFYIVD